MLREERGDEAARIIGNIYEAAADPAAFASLGKLLAEAVSATNGVVVVRENGIPVELSTTTSPDAMDAYLTYFGRMDPWTEITFRAPFGMITRSEECLSEAELKETEFYQDYARHLGIFRPAGTTLALRPGRTITVGVSRAIDAPRFVGRDEAWLLELAQHLRRAIQIRDRSAASAAASRAGLAVLDGLAFGAFVVDARSKVVYMNAAAEALRQEQRGLVLGSGRVTALDLGEARRLAALINAAAAHGHGGAMRLSDAHGDAGLVALVTPLASRVRDELPGEALAFLAIRPTDPPRPPSPEVLSSLFGLSAAEAKVACALALGHDLDTIAADRGVKLSTLRSQLLSIFHKTGTSTQRDLVRLLGMLPQVRC